MHVIQTTAKHFSPRPPRAITSFGSGIPILVTILSLERMFPGSNITHNFPRKKCVERGFYVPSRNRLAVISMTCSWPGLLLVTGSTFALAKRLQVAGWMLGHPMFCRINGCLPGSSVFATQPFEPYKFPNRKINGSHPMVPATVPAMGFTICIPLSKP